MKIEAEHYNIQYDEESKTISFSGSLRAWDPMEYVKIKQFMLDVHDLDISALNLDFKDLDFLNSSGISMLCKFIFAAKKSEKVDLTIIGNKEILWQQKSFGNLQKLWESIELQFD